MRLYVGAHQWASSIRTTGFPVFLYKEDGEIVKVGETSKRPTVYPADGRYIFRTYRSNSGWRTVYVYPLPHHDGVVDVRNMEEIPLSERDDYTSSRLPEGVRKDILRFLGIDVP